MQTGKKNKERKGKYTRNTKGCGDTRGDRKWRKQGFLKEAKKKIEERKTDRKEREEER